MLLIFFDLKTNRRILRDELCRHLVLVNETQTEEVNEEKHEEVFLIPDSKGKLCPAVRDENGELRLLPMASTTDEMASQSNEVNGENMSTSNAKTILATDGQSCDVTGQSAAEPQTLSEASLARELSELRCEQPNESGMLW